MSESKGYIRTSDEKGSINIAHNVITTIAAAAAVDVSGVSALYHAQGKELADNRGRKGISKGAKVTVEGDDITIDVYLIAEIDNNIGEVGLAVQKAVKSAVESAIGHEVKTVNVQVGGIALKKTAQQQVKQGNK